MSKASGKHGDYSAETVFLLRVWYETDSSPRFLLETVRESPNRRLFTQLSELTDWLAIALTPIDDLSKETLQKGEPNEI